MFENNTPIKNDQISDQEKSLNQDDMHELEYIRKDDKANRRQTDVGKLKKQMGSNQEISNLSFSDINGTSHGGLHVSGKNFTRDLVSPMKSAMSKEDKTEEDSPIANESIEGHGEDEMFGYSPEGSQDGDYKTSNRTSPG